MTFDMLRPASVEDAISALVEHGSDAVLVAGGQSLLPLLRQRQPGPRYLVTLAHIDALRGVREDGAEVVIGATTTLDGVLRYPLAGARAELLRQAITTVADHAVRVRGTLGGSLAYADPAADLPAVVLALDAVVVVQGPGGTRTIAAAEFFQDRLRSALAPTEVLVEVRLPALSGQWGFHYEKAQQLGQAWAIVGVAAAVRREDGVFSEARIGLANMGRTPLRATATEDALAGVPATREAVADAAQLAAADTAPISDEHADSDHRADLARALVRQAIEKAVGLWEPPGRRPVHELPGL